MTMTEMQKQREYEKVLVLTCVKNGRVLIKDIIKKTGWTKQKSIELCHLLVFNGILEERVCRFFGKKFKVFYVRGY